MKILTVISIIQIVLILLLFSKVAEIEKSISRPTQTLTAARPEASPFESSNSATGITPVADEDRLRRIIREELAAQLAIQSGAVAPAAAIAAPENRSAEEIAQVHEQVFQQIEYFSSVGRINEVEMQKLQMDIAKLDAAGRTAALRELTRAMNSGRLEGRL